jgi:hypothetical protein
MAKSRGFPKELQVGLALVALGWDVIQTIRHKQTCPSCVNRDYLQIAVDVAHLARYA